MEKDFEQWLKDNFYSWVTARIYTGRIRKEYKRKGYPDLESFVNDEIINKKEIYVPKKAISAFRKFAEFMAKTKKAYAGIDIVDFKTILKTFKVQEEI